ncbi:1-acyl-sn-glycerol-3-phosphate acyltransferase [Bacillus sp. JJ634]
MYYVAAIILKTVLSMFNKVNVYNKQALPNKGPYVIACTHSGWVDVVYLGVILLPSKIHYMAKKQLFKNKISAWFFNKLNAFPVDRDNPGTSVLKIPYKLLSRGEIVGIFPSGTRTNEQIALKQGAITIAQRSNVPIIPAVYKGPNNLKELLLRKRAYLIFGDPIFVKNKSKEDRKYFKQLLEQKLIDLESDIKEKIS